MPDCRGAAARIMGAAKGVKSQKGSPSSAMAKARKGCPPGGCAKSAVRKAAVKKASPRKC